MHKEILTKEQIKLLSLVEEFKKNYILVGGTAIALHLGHRRSIDFDLFTNSHFRKEDIIKKIHKFYKIEKTFINLPEEYTILIKKVRFTFFHFPYKIKAPVSLDKIIKLPDLLTLAAMKAFALGFRAKWKDYIDLYFITKEHYSLKDITTKAKEIFKGEFNERIFREQLGYFKDINYSEKVIYLKGYKVSDKTVKQGLKKISISR